jgi:hypothetical protein
MSDAGTSALRRMLVPPPFRFDMGLRRSQGTFFRNTPAAASILEDRRRWITTRRGRYAAALDEARPLIEETLALAYSLDGTLPRLPTSEADITPTALCEGLGQSLEPDCLFLKEEGPDFRLVGGCLCYPSSWSLEEKLGKPLISIHAPVPTLNEGYATRIHSFLDALQPGSEWERFNWGLAATPERNLHPALGRPRPGATARLDSTWLRVEHQALRRLPRSAGVLFGIRLQVYRLDVLAADATLAQHLADLLETMPKEVAEYKGLGTARPGLVRALRGGGGAMPR